MKLTLVRAVENNNSTAGVLYLDGEFICHTLEDGYREKKEYGKTRIPEGTYNITFRKEGAMHKRYNERFNFHKGMLHLQHVHNFRYIYIHIGNTITDTLGCILVGNKLKKQNGNFRVNHSTIAYKKLYQRITKKLKYNEELIIEIK